MKQMSVVGESMLTKMLFVCAGNTCRSPMAEVIARDLLASRELFDVCVRSAGITAVPGHEANVNAVLAASSAGLDLSQHRSEMLDEDTVRWADAVIVMEEYQINWVSSLGGGQRCLSWEMVFLIPLDATNIHTMKYFVFYTVL